jgi:porin
MKGTRGYWAALIAAAACGFCAAQGGGEADVALQTLEEARTVDASRDAAVAEAVTTAEDAAEPGFWDRDTMTGEWGGLRTRLRDAGVDFSFLLIVDGVKNFHGGAESGGDEFHAVFDAIATFDFDKLFGWKGGSLVADMQFLRGDPANDVVGALGGVNALDTAPRTQLAQLYFDQTFADGLFKVRLGKFDANYDFAFPAAAGPFVNSSAAASPTLLSMPTYPNPAFGAAFYFEPETWYFRAAVMDGAALEGVNTGHHGPRTLFGRPADLYYIAEGGPKWTLGGDLPGKFTIGAWYHDGTFSRFDGGSEDGEIGPYLMIEQRLSRENPGEKDDAQGFDAFLRYGHASDAISAVDHHVLVGVTYTGPIDGRDDDVLGAAVSWLHTSDDPSSGFDRSAEFAVEAFYKIQICPWCSLQPDLQYVVNPGGVSGVDDAWLASLRLFVSF